MRRYLDRGDQVFAACRSPHQAVELAALKSEYAGRLAVIQLEVTNLGEIEAAVDLVKTQVPALDILINNAGMSPSGETLENLKAETMLETLSVNAVAPVIIAQKYKELLAAGENPKLVNVTSQLGSLARKRSGGRYSYNGSKAALNMYSRALAFDLQGDGVITIMIHPGWVQTDMGGRGASLTVAQSALGVMAVIDSLTMKDLGRFLQWDGSELPW